MKEVKNHNTLVNVVDTNRQVFQALQLVPAQKAQQKNINPHFKKSFIKSNFMK
jgi:hypothetical protein